MSQFTEPGRDGYTAGRDIHINNHYGDQRTHTGSPRETPSSSEPEPEAHDDLKQSGASPSTSDSSGGCGFPVAIAILGLIIWIVTSCSGSSNSANPFPANNSPWPAGATHQQILALATTWLTNCAKQNDNPAPEGCPESVSDADDGIQVSNVRWQIHGDPGDGAQIRYSGGKFWILGHALMTVTYDESGQQYRDVDVFGYQTTASWNNGRPAIASPMLNVGLDHGPPVQKQNPGIPSGLPPSADASALVLKQFKACAALHETPLPDTCMGIGDEGDHARWALNSDPTLNATEFFDRSTGLIHVKGSYSMTNIYQTAILGSHHSIPKPGKYDAIMSVDHGHLTPLGINPG